MTSDQMLEIVKLYRAARLNFFSHQFAMAQEQLKMQELVFISMKQGYLNAQKKLMQARECYQMLISQSSLVHISNLFHCGNNLQTTCPVNVRSVSIQCNNRVGC